jgi:UDP-N-acetyl-D-glucosamine dehydrogenase
MSEIDAQRPPTALAAREATYPFAPDAEVASAMPPALEALARRVRDRSAVVGVVGQGYVGFPLAQLVAREGFMTIGFDISERVVAMCRARNEEPAYSAEGTFDRLRNCDVVVIAVPTPTRDDDGGRHPDLGPVRDATAAVAAHPLPSGRGRLVAVESTYAPGTTRRVVAPLLDPAGAHIGTTIALGYSPERIDPGNDRFHVANIPKVTSGIDSASASLTELFYRQIVERVAPASSLEAAEATKLLENTFRFVNIAFAQEFDEYCERIGVNAREVTGLAASKPFGFMPFYAGAGIGGHCIAEDPYFLREAIIQIGGGAPILEAAIENHQSRAEAVFRRVAEVVGAERLAKSRVLLLGVSYKPNIGDLRRTPALDLLALLEAAGAAVDYHDPYVEEFAGRSSLDVVAADPADYALAVMVTRHRQFEPARLRAAGWKLFDLSDSPGRPRAGAWA